MTAVLELDDVLVAYPRRGREALTIARDLDVAIRPGTMHCIAGRSGSGKTTMLRVAAGLMHPSGGDVRWQGESIIALSDDDRTRRRARFIGYLDQSAALVPELTVGENVLIPAVPQRRVKELSDRAARLLEQLGLADRADARPSDLSGGERQRAGLARALLLSPALLIVDEPTASLDRDGADEVIELLIELRRSGTALLVASHDPHLIDAADLRTHLA